MGDWISVEERLPGKWTDIHESEPNEILVSGWSGVKAVYWHEYGDSWAITESERYRGGFTHWMPLPEPPKGEG